MPLSTTAILISLELIPKTVHAPEIGQVWLNSAPLSLKQLRGSVVLIDFWDYTCVNCLRTLPYLKEWHRRYAGQGLQIIGVHAPEFSFSKNRVHIERAIAEQGLEYPVVLDNDYTIWQAFANKAWPAKYVIDKDGYIRFFTLGEGHYQDVEEALQELLLDARPGVKMPPLMTPIRALDEPGALQFCLRPTPELYCGTGRGRIANPEPAFEPDKMLEFHYGAALPPEDLIELDGWWATTPESVVVAASIHDTRGSRLRLRFSAAEVNVVIHPEKPGTVNVTLDGQPLKALTVDAPRMYNLFSGDEFRQGLLELTSRTTGMELFAFTFIGCLDGVRA